MPALASASMAPVAANDNRRAAGTLKGGTLTLSLRAALGLWQPEGADGPSLQIEAFGEAGSALTAPAPLIRVPEGTRIVASVKNDLTVMLRVHGFCERNDAPCQPLDVRPGESREARFTSGRPGTYHYWATTTGMPQAFRASMDTQLSGAFVVDPAGSDPDDDRVLVVTEWSSVTRDQLQEIARADDPGMAFEKLNPRFTFLINGLAWPATERLTYQLGESVRWRVVNLSTQMHPMHLHGFYYEVDSLGDGLRDVPSAEGGKRRVVTQLLRPGATMALTWKPEREGNWLFHCHIMHHVSPLRRLARGSDSHAGHHAGHSPAAGMAGMVLGVTVLGPARPEAARATAHPSPRKLALTMRSERRAPDEEPAYGFVLVEGEAALEPRRVSVPGPTLVLRRGEPVDIALVNQLPEGTAIHWHGMELESYYDGVHGWSGSGGRTTPIIEPGGTFHVRFTPPRTGTFIYHTHLHDHRQLASGLYGPMIVVESGETFDAARDHVLVLGRSGGSAAQALVPDETAPVLLNGERAPQFVWTAGQRHRVRLINITPDDVFVVSLQTPDGPVTWRPLTKDGAPLPPADCAPAPARQTIAVGETYDFEYEAPPGRRNLWIEVRSTGGKWQAQGRIIFR